MEILILGAFFDCDLTDDKVKFKWWLCDFLFGWASNNSNFEYLKDQQPYPIWAILIIYLIGKIV